MEFEIPCECGRRMTVSQGAAGARIPCDCGRTVDVPSLAALRTSVGLPPVELPLEVEVETLIESGELPAPDCIACGDPVAERCRLVAECEKSYSKDTHDESGNIISASLIMVMALMTGWLVYFKPPRRGGDVIQYGRDTSIPVPVSLCGRWRDSLLRPPRTGGLNRLGNVLCLIGLFCAICGFVWNAAGLIVVGLALRVVAVVQSSNHQRRLRRILVTVPIYQRVFARFPEATVWDLECE